MDREYLVTIPLNLYNELIEIRLEKERVEENLETALEMAELSWDGKDLDFEYESMRDLMKSISLVAYKRRVEELKNNIVEAKEIKEDE